MVWLLQQHYFLVNYHHTLYCYIAIIYYKRKSQNMRNNSNTLNLMVTIPRMVNVT